MSGSMRRKTSLASASLNLIVLASLAGSPAQAAPAGELARQGSSSLFSGQVTVWTPLVRLRREAKPESKPKKNPSKPEKKKGEAAFELDCLAAHNKWRRLHGAPELVVDKKITKFAQKRADFIAKSDGDEFKHPADLDYGENLAWHSVSAKSCHDLVKMWYDEIELYDFKRSKFDHETGHFTQLVWRDTTRVGCARAISSGPRGGIYLVCNYDPPGNFLGEERGNVLERIGSQARDLASTPVASKPSTTSTLAPPVTTQIAVSSTTTISPTTYSSSSSTEKPKKKKKTTTTTKKKSNKKKKSKKGKKKKKKQGNKKAKLTTTVRVPDDLLSL